LKGCQQGKYYFRGGKMGFFSDALDNYEKRSKAREYRQRGEEIIERANSKYQEKYSRVSDYVYETQRKITSHYNYKKDIMRKLDIDVTPVLTAFEKFDIDKKVMSAPIMPSGSDSALSLNFDSSSAFKRSLDDCKGNFSIPIFDFFGDASDEYYAAKMFKVDAEVYAKDLEYRRSELDTLKTKMSVIRDLLYEERNLLDRLVPKLNNISAKLKTDMKRSSFSEAEANYAKAVYEIAKTLSLLLTTKFIDDNFDITNHYQRTMDAINSINNNLPETPENLSSGEWQKLLTIKI
jgi:hypothetical protein